MSGPRRVLTAAALALALGLGGCGKSGDTIPPEGTTFPRTYPAPRYVLPERADADAGVKPEPADTPRRRQDNLQFLPTDDRTTVRTIGPAPAETPTPSATPETSTTPATPETLE